MREAYIVIMLGLVEDYLSKTGSGQQLKSPPRMREYVLRSGSVKMTWRAHLQPSKGNLLTDKN